MNAGPTAERIYNGIRTMLLDGEFRPTARLDPSELSARLGSSVTPVREALCVLEGEGLVESRTSGGFYVRALDAPALADLYAWAGEVLETVARTVAREEGSLPPMRSDLPQADEPGDRMADLCLLLASASPNEEHRRAVLALNARLRPTRLVERSTIPETEAELEQLERAYRAADLPLLRSLIRRYHRRRRKAVSVVLRALLRSGAA